MKTKTLTAPHLEPARPLRQLLREIPAVDHESALDNEEALKKFASLTTCDTFNAGFLTGILFVPNLRK